MPPAIPTDPVRAAAELDRLTHIYASTERWIEQTIQVAVRRGNRGTATYYRTQLLRVQAALNRLQREAIPLARSTVQNAYLSGMTAVDLHAATILPSMTGINQGAMNQLSAALAAPLQRISQTVGRQAADSFRQAGLLESGIGIASGRPGRQTALAIERNLSRQGITGFVDRSGRRWAMSTYAHMVARTTVREAVTQGTVDRMSAHGLDLITISEHDGSCEICQEFEGETYSLSGDTPGYDEAPDLPPFHPNCEHVATPATADFESFLGALDGEPVSPDAGTASLDAEQQLAEQQAGALPPSIETAPAAGTVPRIPLTGNLLGRVTDPTQIEDIFHPTHALARAGQSIGAQHVNPRRILRAQNLIRQRTQQSLEARGLPDEFTVYRSPADEMTVGEPIHVYLTDPGGADLQPMLVDRSAILADNEAFFGPIHAGDLLVHPESLRSPLPTILPAPRIRLTGNLLGAIRSPRDLEALFHARTPLEHLQSLEHIAGRATASRLDRALKIVAEKTRQSLDARGLTEPTITVYRTPGMHLGDTPFAVSLVPESGPVLGLMTEPMIIARDRILADEEAFFGPGRANRLLVRGDDLHPPGTSIEPPAPAGPPAPASAERLSTPTARQIMEGFDPTTATPADLRALGGRIRAEIEVRVPPIQLRLQREYEQQIDDIRAQKAAIMRTSPTEAYWNDPAYKKLDDEYYRIRRARPTGIQAARREATLQVLSEIRPMGGELAIKDAGRVQRQLAGLIREHAAPYLPRDWIEASNRNGQIIPIRDTKGRAWHETVNWRPGQEIGDSEIHIAADQDPSTVYHEMLHRMEYAVDRIMKLENAYLEERRLASGEADIRLRRLRDLTGNTGFKADEVAYIGNFTNVYMGKSYKRYMTVERRGVRRFMDGQIQGDGELLTMGGQGAIYGDYELWESDLPYLDFVLGLLAGI